MEDGIPRRQPLFRTQSAQQVHKLVKKPLTKTDPPSMGYMASRSYDDLNINKSRPTMDLAVPTCNSTMKIIDQMENLKFEQFDPILTSTHKDHITEQVQHLGDLSLSGSEDGNHWVWNDVSCCLGQSKAKLFQWTSVQRFDRSRTECGGTDRSCWTARILQTKTSCQILGNILVRWSRSKVEFSHLDAFLRRNIRHCRRNVSNRTLWNYLTKPPWFGKAPGSTWNHWNQRKWRRNKPLSSPFRVSIKSKPCGKYDSLCGMSDVFFPLLSFVFA